MKKKDHDEDVIRNLKQRKEQLAGYTENMINIQYLENFLNYFYDETAYIWDYMNDPVIFIDDPARILETLEVREKEMADDIEALVSAGRGVGEDFQDCARDGPTISDSMIWRDIFSRRSHLR